MSETIHIPILRLGNPYRSLDTIDFPLPNGRELSVSVANAGLIRRDLQNISRAVESLQAIPCDTLAGYCEKAAELFLHEKLPWGDTNGDGALQTPDDYVGALSHDCARCGMASSSRSPHPHPLPSRGER